MPGLPTIKIFSLVIPSFIRFFLLSFVGAKCMSATEDINLRLSSSG